MSAVIWTGLWHAGQVYVAVRPSARSWAIRSFRLTWIWVTTCRYFMRRASPASFHIPMVSYNRAASSCRSART